MKEAEVRAHVKPMTQTAALETQPADAPPASPRGLPPAGAATHLRSCREMALEALQRLAAHTLDRLDDALFELADKAENNAQQRVYFDAMRDVRLRRAGMETALRAQLQEQFERRSASPSPFGRPAGESSSGASLGLVENDELEVSIAVENMVAKAHGLYEDELYALDRRVGHLLGDPDLKGARNPFSPETICESVRKASATLETGLTVQLLVLKLFDRHLVADLQGLYQALNHHLASRNVLPSIQRPNLGRPVVRPTRATNAPGRGAVSAPLEPDVVSLIQELAAATRPGQAVSFTGGGTTVALPQMLGALSVLQTGQSPAGMEGFEGFEGLQGLQLDPVQVAAGTVNVLHQLRSGGFSRGMDQVDDLMLELVTLLFDYVLDDKAIPTALKALIGRLQIPLLKVAILDKALFARKNHPARRLLNALAGAAVGWDENRDGNDELFHAVEGVVQRVLKDFDKNVELFSELLTEFETFLAAQEQRAQQRAELSVKILQGRERLDLAKAAAEAEVRRCLAMGPVPAPVREFLDRHWRNLLVVTHNREGETSELWETRVRMLETLVWSILPKRTPAERRELLAALPSFVRTLSDTIRTLSIEDEERSRFVAALARYQAAAMKGETPPNTVAADTGNEPEASPAPSGGAMEPTVLEPRTDIDLGSPARFPGQAGAPEPEGRDLVTAILGLPPARPPQPASHAGGEFEEIVIEAPRLEPEPAAPPAPAPEHDAHVEAAQGLAIGTWVEFVSESGARTRARLTWVSSVTGVYLFTDRRGMKVAERTTAGLALDFRRGSARLMESVPLFDRAVSHLMQGLRRTNNASH